MSPDLILGTIVLLAGAAYVGWCIPHWRRLAHCSRSIQSGAAGSSIMLCMIVAPMVVITSDCK